MTRSTSGPPPSGPNGSGPNGSGPDNPGPDSPTGGISGSIAGDLEPCGSCGRSVAPRALFCHACGAVQPPRALDPFTRLGMERRFDIDLDLLARQHAGFTRALDPERFATRGPRQQANARAQGVALREAHDTLRDPVRRAHALLALLGGQPANGQGGGQGGGNDGDDEIADLAATLAKATDTAELDRIGLDLSQRIEACIKYLAPAFRKAQSADGTDGAARILTRLERLEALAAEASTRRAAHPPPRS